MPGFEDVTPTVLQSPVPREAPAEKRHVKEKKKTRKESARSDFRLAAFRFGSCFLKSLRLVPALTSQRECDRTV